MMRRRDVLEGLVAGALLLPAASAMAQAVTPAVKSSIAPTGRLRIAINYGNAALAKRDPATGKLSGVSVDIAGELGRRLGLPVDLVPFDAAGKVSGAAAQNVWDVAFLARDPERAKDISFTAAYVVIEGNYVVRDDSPMTTLAQVDQDGVRVIVSTRSAYDLFLSRNLKHAKLVHGGSTPEAVALFNSGHYEVVAGVKQALQQVIANDKGLRMIPNRSWRSIRPWALRPGGRRAAPGCMRLWRTSRPTGMWRRSWRATVRWTRPLRLGVKRIYFRST